MSDRRGEPDHRKPLDRVSSAASATSVAESQERDANLHVAIKSEPAQNGAGDAHPPPRSIDLPPLSRLPGVLSSRKSPGVRSTGMASILNPIDAPGGVVESRRRSAAQMEAPGQSPSFLPPLAISEQHSNHEPVIPGSLLDRTPRRILTPRSPSIHRAASLSQLNQPSATINAQQSPFPGSPRARRYMLEPGTGGIPPMPITSAGARSSHGFPTQITPTHSARRGSTDAPLASGPASNSTSPTSSYSQPGHGSPPASYNTSYAPTRSDQYMPNADASGSLRTFPEQHRAVSIPIAQPAGSSTYQMMTVTTSSGPVSLPVDIQAASRVADEKRKRNAGASARFRQRRKEKEKESSVMIARLEHQVKELSDDLAFYKRECEIMASTLRQMPGGERHFPRPPSPHGQRSIGPSAGPHAANSGSLGHTGLSEHDDRSSGDGRNVRRRTSTASLPPPPVPHQQPPLPGSTPTYQHSFSTPSYGTVRGQQLPPAPGPLPSPHGRGTLPPPSPAPQLMQAPLQTGPWNPYAHERRVTGPPSQPHDGR